MPSLSCRKGPLADMLGTSVVRSQGFGAMRSAVVISPRLVGTALTPACVRWSARASGRSRVASHDGWPLFGEFGLGATWLGCGAEPGRAGLWSRWC